jgi:hypothetical protein
MDRWHSVISVTLKKAGTSTLPVTWDVSNYDNSSGATNTFTWTINLGIIKNTAGVLTTGTVIVTNA